MGGRFPRRRRGRWWWYAVLADSGRGLLVVVLGLSVFFAVQLQ